MTIALQNIDGIILLQEINASFVSRGISNWINFLISVKLRKKKILFSAKLGDMDKFDQTTSSKPGFSTNMENSSMNKRGRLVAQILATKFHTDPAREPEADKEIILDPIIRYLIINEHADRRYKRAVKKKQSKRHKTRIKAEAIKSVGENQPVWLSTLKEEITNLE
jgi:hypothetical protein